MERPRYFGSRSAIAITRTRDVGTRRGQIAHISRGGAPARLRRLGSGETASRTTEAPRPTIRPSSSSESTKSVSKRRNTPTRPRGVEVEGRARATTTTKVSSTAKIRSPAGRRPTRWPVRCFTSNYMYSYATGYARCSHVRRRNRDRPCERATHGSANRDDTLTSQRETPNARVLRGAARTNFDAKSGDPSFGDRCERDQVADARRDDGEIGKGAVAVVALRREQRAFPGRRMQRSASRASIGRRAAGEGLASGYGPASRAAARHQSALAGGAADSHATTPALARLCHRQPGQCCQRLQGQLAARSILVGSHPPRRCGGDQPPDDARRHRERAGTAGE